MTYSINTTMISDPLTVTGPSPTYTVTSTDNTGSISPGLYWGMNGTSGSAGQVLTSNGTGSTIFADPNLKGASIQVKGNAEFDGEVTIKGKNLNDTLERIEEKLAILRPNEELEEKWEELRNLRNAYKKLEAEIIEKEKVWAILKK